MPRDREAKPPAPSRPGYHPFADDSAPIIGMETGGKVDPAEGFLDRCGILWPLRLS